MDFAVVNKTPPFLVRQAFPDEIARAQALGQGAVLPGPARFLVAIVEQPVERIIAAFPYWPQPDSPDQAEGQPSYEFALYFGTSLANKEPLLDEALTALEAAASVAGARHLHYQAALPAIHPFYQKLRERGFEIDRTGQYCSVSGEIAKERARQAFVPSELPAHWRVESIRGHKPEEIYKLVVDHQSLSPQQFQMYWDSSNREHFEESYSFVLIEQEEIIGLFLITRRGDHGLHIHVETAHPDYHGQSRLIYNTLRHQALSQCSAGFPEAITWRTNSNHYPEPANSSFAHGSTEQTSLHFLAKALVKEPSSSQGDQHKISE